MESADTAAMPVEEPSIFRGYMPALRLLTIHHVSLPRLVDVVNGLVNFELVSQHGQPSISDLFTMLEQCPKLESLVLADCDWQGLYYDLPERRVHLPHLTKLQILHISPHITASILAHLVLPRKTNMRLDNRMWDDQMTGFPMIPQDCDSPPSLAGLRVVHFISDDINVLTTIYAYHDPAKTFDEPPLLLQLCNLVERAAIIDLASTFDVSALELLVLVNVRDDQLEEAVWLEALAEMKNLKTLRIMNMDPESLLGLLIVLQHVSKPESVCPLLTSIELYDVPYDEEIESALADYARSRYAGNVMFSIKLINARGWVDSGELKEIKRLGVDVSANE